MKEEEFKELLKKKRVSVVHFSHCAIMSHRVAFPEDLRHALDNPTETRSCCAIFPLHKMNLPGSVGIIYEPNFADVLSVSNTDSGSSAYNGIEGSLGNNPSKKTIVDSLAVKDGDYNEWRIRGLNPIGIYVHNPDIISAKRNLLLTINGYEFPDLVETQIELGLVFESFPNLSVYTMKENGLNEVTRA